MKNKKRNAVILFSGLIAWAFGYAVEIILLSFRPESADPDLPRELNRLNILIVFLLSWPVLYYLFGIRHGVIHSKNEKLAKLLQPKPAAFPLPKDPASSLKDGKREAKAFRIIALCAGIIILFLTPPLTAPDEQAHFTCIYPISRGQLIAQPDEDGNCCRTYPAEWGPFFSEYPDRLLGVKNTEKYHMEDVQKALTLTPDSGKTEKSYVTGVSLGYCAAAIGMRIASAVGDLTGIKALNSIYGQITAGRLFNLICYVLLIGSAIRRAPHFRRTILLVGCMPMTLYLGCSLNYDAILIPICIYFVALIISLCHEPEKPLSAGEIAKVYGCVFLMTGIKYAYAPLLALLLAIPRKKYGGWGKLTLCVTGAVIAGALGFLPTLLQNRLIPPIEGYTPQKEQTWWLQTHLSSIPGLFLNTVNVRGASYVISFWGCLGWLDVHIPYGFIAAGVFIIFLNALYEGFSYMDWAGKRWKNLLPFIGSSVCIVGIAITMYISHTTIYHAVGGPVIEGIQGRYFIPCFLPMVLAMSNSSLKNLEAMDRPDAGEGLSRIAIVWSGCCALITIGTLLLRYWI